MTVIEVKLAKNRNKTDARSNQKTFFEWCDSNGLGLEGFSEVASSELTYKGKRITFYVAAYGSFWTLDGWVLFISYRGDIVNHVRYHTWRWNDGKADIASHKLNEYINI